MQLPKRYVTLPHDLFGFFSDRFKSQIAFGRSDAPPYLTLSDFFSSPFSSTERYEFQKIVQQSDQTKLRRYFKLPPRSQLVKQQMHLCPLCVREDENVFGVAFWRNVHQVPAVLHCPTHFSRLVPRCIECDSLTRRWRALAPPKCCHHHSSNAKESDDSLSSTYRWFLDACQSVSIGGTNLVTPAVRQKIYSEALENTGGADLREQRLLLTRQIKHQWGCKPGYYFDGRFDVYVPNHSLIAHVLENLSVPNVLAHLIVLSAIQAPQLPDLPQY